MIHQALHTKNVFKLSSTNKQFVLILNIHQIKCVLHFTAQRAAIQELSAGYHYAESLKKLSLHLSMHINAAESSGQPRCDELLMNAMYLKLKHEKSRRQLTGAL